MIDKDMMDEVLRWMVQNDEDNEIDNRLLMAEIDPEAVAYFMDVVPEDIMIQAVKQFGKTEQPQNIVRLAMGSVFTIAFEAGSRCRKLNIERGGD